MKFKRRACIHIGASYSSLALISLLIITMVISKKRQNDEKKIETELKNFEIKNMLTNVENN